MTATKIINRADLVNVLTANNNHIAENFAPLDSNGKVPVANLPAEVNAIETVATYSELPSTGNYNGRRVLVLDASGDPTVTSGFAIYIYSTAENPAAFVKVAEGESMDVVTDWANIQNKPELASSTHVHGNISNDGKVGTTANLPLITGTGGAVQAGSFGNAANTFCEGNDSRLSDSRDPNDHASNKVTAMTGYSEPNSTSAIAATDSLNTAIGKLEKKADLSAASIDMSGYSKAGSASAIATSDDVVGALGKLEYKVDAIDTTDLSSSDVSSIISSAWA